MCLDAGRTTLATIVDHVVPVVQDGPDTDINTRNLCDEHHHEVTAVQFGQQVAIGARGVGR